MMDQLTSPALPGSMDRPIKRVTPRQRYTRYFFVGMACNFIILTALGFIPDYVLFHYNRQIIVHWSAHFHGAVMGLWLLIFLAQSTLAVRGHLKYHRQLGVISFGFSAFVWLTMVVITARRWTSFPYPVADGVWDILLIALFGILLFPLFLLWGALKRKEASAHQRLMLLATLVVMQASIDRVRFLPAIGEAFFVRFLYFDLLLLVPLFIYDLVSLRHLHKVTIIGVIVIFATQALIVTAGTRNWWHRTAFAMFAPFVEPDIEIKLTDDQISQLVGEYGSTDSHVTVSYEDQKLYVQLPQSPKLEMFATSDSQTALIAVGWHVLFIRNKAGRVIKIINKQPDVEWELNKISP